MLPGQGEAEKASQLLSALLRFKCLQNECRRTPFRLQHDARPLSVRFLDASGKLRPVDWVGYNVATKSVVNVIEALYTNQLGSVLHKREKSPLQCEPIRMAMPMALL